MAVEALYERDVLGRVVSAGQLHGYRIVERLQPGQYRLLRVFLDETRFAVRKDSFDSGFCLVWFGLVLLRLIPERFQQRRRRLHVLAVLLHQLRRVGLPAVLVVFEPFHVDILPESVMNSALI